MKPFVRLMSLQTGRWSAGFVMVAVLAAMLAPVLPIADPNTVSLSDKLLEPSLQHWLGTDSLGRDLFARLIWGARTTLLCALGATLLTALLGALAGGFAAVADRRASAAVMRLCDLWMSFPSEVLILAVVGMLGPGLENIVLACFAAKWPWYARMMHTIISRHARAGFVDFARVAGASKRWILFRHLLPNAGGDFCVLVTLDTAGVILIISALSFLGLGVSAPTAEWGMMLADAKNVMTLYPWQMLPPGLAILATAAALHFLGDALRDALDPALDAERRR